jgi:RNA recognition motif-containing protein
MNIYVGNMSYNTSEPDLRRAFEEFGAVDSVKVIMDRDTGRPRGFAFVEMPDDDQARQAIEGLNGVDMQGRNLTVNEARPREERPARQRW